MASHTRFTCIALSTVVVIGALFSGSAPAFADPFAAGQIDPGLSADLRRLAAVFGDPDGHLVVRKPDGSMVVLARLVRDFEIYTAGDEVAADDTFAFCHEERGQLSACEVLRDPGGATGYECVPDPVDSYCWCDIGFDCIEMLIDGPCDPGLSCNDEICVCNA